MNTIPFFERDCRRAICLLVCLASCAAGMSQRLCGQAIPGGGTAQPRRAGVVSQQPGSASVAGPDDPLHEGLIREESDLDLAKAVESYQEAVARFDQQRPAAANAMFRLAEAYRRMGKMEEAKVFYGRIIREFPDQAELARLSSQHLFPATVGVAQSQVQTRLHQIVQAPPLTVRGFGDFPNSSLTLGNAGVRGVSGISGSEATFDRNKGNSPELIELEQRLAHARLEQFSAEAKVRDLRILRDSVKDANPVALPSRAAIDLRYQALKQEYQASLLAGNDQSVINKSLERIRKWVQEIYLPELNSEIQFEDTRLDSLKEATAMLQSRVKLLEPEEIAEERRRAARAQERAQELERRRAEEERRKAEAAANDPTAPDKLSTIMKNLIKLSEAKNAFIASRGKKQGEQISDDEFLKFLVEGGGDLPEAVAGEMYHVNPVGTRPTATLANYLGIHAPGVVFQAPRKAELE